MAGSAAPGRGRVSCVSEPGVWILNVDSEMMKNQNNFFYFTKTLFKNSTIRLKVLLDSCNTSSPVLLNVAWYLRNSHCYDEVFSLDVRHTLLFSVLLDSTIRTIL
ncbi:hypothetical protein LDENG_00082240 [Lucifuga dentata]|nr:hypothetical protein LDENG_00082240 [Lucifuga dentata]